MVNDKDDTGIALPSINQALLATLLVVSAFRVSESLGGVLLGSTSPLNLAINGLFCLASMFFLFKSLQPIDYDRLEGFAEQSLARQAGVWALRNEIPGEYQGYQVATFSGGCFWGTELHFQRIPGVFATCVGYTQGALERPTYEQVCSGRTGHTEGIQLLFDPNVCCYESLVRKLLSTVDPTLLNQVGNDRGTQYRHGIYPHTPSQQETAQQVLKEVQSSYGSPIVTELKQAVVFWPAENYHQRYLEKRGQSAEKNCDERVRCYG